MLTTCITLLSCSNKAGKNQLKGIKIVYKIPIVENGNAAREMINSYDIIFYQDLILYKLTYIFDSLFNGRPVLSEESKMYFVFHKDSVFGRTYFERPSQMGEGGRLTIDSVLRTYAFEIPEKIDSFSNVAPDTVYTDKDGNRIRGYKNTFQSPDMEKFDLFFYYNGKFKGISFSLLKKMDEFKGLKLYKIGIFGSGGYHKEQNAFLPAREFYYEMKELKIEEPDKLTSFFSKYLHLN